MSMTPDLIDTRRFDGTSLRRCSHGLAFEEKCERCFDEALANEGIDCTVPAKNTVQPPSS